MQESQDIEWKKTMKDEYLKWICGFANAAGGRIIIGKNDKGEFLEIIVEPQPFPVNYKGQYHYRSGSTKQELKSAALDKFMLEKTIELLFTKYIKAIISYEGIHRVETYEYPKDAVREAVLNALSHKDYSIGAPIQISVYDDKIMIWNYGQLPEDWTVENLMQKHSSIPYNPDIANAFFRAGYVEAWGRGTIKISEQCRELGIPNPEFQNKGKDFWVIFRKDIFNKEYLEKLKLNERQIKAMLYTNKNGKISNKEYQKICGCSRNTASNELKLLTEKGLLNYNDSKGAGSYYFIAH